MSFESFVALRYLAASRRRAHVALISTISILGLAVGVAALVISLSLLSGFQDRIRAQMADRSPHLLISPERGDRLADPDAVARKLQSLGDVVAIDPVIDGRAWLSDLNGRGTTPVRYRALPKEFAAPGGDDPGAVPARISFNAAGRTGATVGSLLRVLSSHTRLSPLGPIPIETVVRVAEIRRASALERAADLEVPEPTARLLSGLYQGARAYEARLKDPAASETTAREVVRALGPAYRVQTWQDLNRPLSFALRLEKTVMFATVALVIVVAALNIVSTLALLVVEKKRDLGVLTAMGAPPSSLVRIYLTLGSAIGALGTSAGILLGVVASFLMDRFHLVPLPADVYLMSHVPFAVHTREVLLVALFAFATAFAAAVLPARAAARLAPGEAVRLSR